MFPGTEVKSTPEVSDSLTPPPELSVQTLPEAWAEWLAVQPWEWFVTLTFAESIHPEAADKKFRLWISKLNIALHGKNYHRHPHKLVIWARGIEMQKRDVLHFHALLRRVGFESRTRWMKEWEKIGGGFARIYPPEDISDVCAYTSKYITKGGEIDLSPSMVTAIRCGEQTSL